MKLKQQPQDFRVEETTQVVPGKEGAFSFYRLEKRGWATLDALLAIKRRWHLQSDQLSFGGIKDRHADTVQFLTIRHGPRRDLTHHQITLRYLGQIEHPYHPSDIRSNRFEITLRGLDREDIPPALVALEEIRSYGVANYFDDQRFGSVEPGGDFVARCLIHGRYEQALRLALAAPYRHDPAAKKREKEILRLNWGDWATCKAKLPRGDASGPVDYLLGHPSDFRGAFARMRHELASLYLSAYQSFLWNQILARVLAQICTREQLAWVPLRLGRVPMHRSLDAEQMAKLKEMVLPLPSARLKLSAEDPRASLYAEVLAKEEMSLSDMKIRGLREVFFSKGDRPALLMPIDMKHEAGDDELHPGEHKLTMAFELPRGAYATLIVKRLQNRRKGGFDADQV
jgi:tRNA pseudouridine13 synthase